MRRLAASYQTSCFSNPSPVLGVRALRGPEQGLSSEPKAGFFHFRVITTSRYSLGTTMVVSPDLFMRTISA